MFPMLRTLAATLASAAIAAAADPDPRPNILFLLADDLGYEALGCYGGKDFQTPHLDALADGGMRFARAYTSPVCTPSRMTLYTGSYVDRHGEFDVLPVHLGTRRAIDFSGRFTTYPQLLRAAGYATAVTGKWQLATLEFHPDHCHDAGFDSWCVWQIWRDGAKTTRYWNPTFNHDGNVRDDIAERYGPDVLADYVIAQMEAAVAAGKPFYIHHNMLLPHEPILATPADKAAGETPSLAHMIAYTDTIVGRLVAAVERLGISEETYFIFMGDNGTEAAHGPVRQTAEGAVHGGKRDLTDAGTHVPLIVRRPGHVPEGVVADSLVDMADWFATFCSLAGVAVPEGSAPDSIPFATTIVDGTPSERRYVTGGIGGRVSIFDGNTRLTGKRGEGVASVLERMHSATD